MPGKASEFSLAWDTLNQNLNDFQKRKQRPLAGKVTSTQAEPGAIDDLLAKYDSLDQMPEQDIDRVLHYYR
jgi:hypothetical protein